MGRSAATAKPIGAHPILGCPFAMYQISSVTHILEYCMYIVFISIYISLQIYNANIPVYKHICTTNECMLYFVYVVYDFICDI